MAVRLMWETLGRPLDRVADRRVPVIDGRGVRRVGSDVARIGCPDGPAPTTTGSMADTPHSRHAAAAKKFFFISLPNFKKKQQAFLNEIKLNQSL
jgi:hypothetical protein